MIVVKLLSLTAYFVIMSYHPFLLSVLIMPLWPLCVSPSGEMVRQARVLAQATSDLVNAMRSDAEAEVDLDNSKKLLAAAKLLADATARMVEAAKVSHVSNIKNVEQVLVVLYLLLRDLSLTPE